MNNTQLHGKAYPLLFLMSLTFILVSLVACEGRKSGLGSAKDSTLSASQAVQPGTVSSLTPSLPPAARTGEAVNATIAAFHTAVADGDATREATLAPAKTAYVQTVTAVALTPSPTDLPLVPTPTWVMGAQLCETSVSTRMYEFTSCWIGIVNGEVLVVGAGVRNSHNGPIDPTKGIVVVYRGLDSNWKFSDQQPVSYDTPTGIGAVQIASVNGTRLDLASVNWATPDWYTPWVAHEPIATTFDLATRQFGSP